MLFQINTVKLSIMSAIQMVQVSNDPDPRLWKSIADLQTVFADLIKNLANYVVYLENNYRIQKEELEEGTGHAPRQLEAPEENAAIAENTESVEEKEDTTEFITEVEAEEIEVIKEEKEEVEVKEAGVVESNVIKQKGSKLNLITNAKNLVDELNENNTHELVKKMEVNPLTNPHLKEELAVKKGIDLSLIEEDSDYDQLNDIV